MASPVPPASVGTLTHALPFQCRASPPKAQTSPGAGLHNPHTELVPEGVLVTCHVEPPKWAMATWSVTFGSSTATHTSSAAEAQIAAMKLLPPPTGGLG